MAQPVTVIRTSQVADAASELFIELFGQNGRATRTVTPNITNIVTELDMVVSVKD